MERERPTGRSPTALERSWSKKPSSSSVGVGDRSDPSADGSGTHLELLAAGLHRLERPVEHDLEAGQLLVAVVLGLVAQAAGLVPGLLDDALGGVLRLPDDLGALHHALGPDPGRFEDVVALALDLGQELLALLEHPAGLAQLLGEALGGVLSSSRTSSLLISTEVDSGIDLALPTTSMTRRSSVSVSGCSTAIRRTSP